MKRLRTGCRTVGSSSLTALAILSGITCGGDSTAPEPPRAVSIAFVVQPSNAIAGASLNPAIQIAVRDAAGNTVTTATAAVSISITAGTGAAGASLGGVVTRAAVNGVATFPDLLIAKAGLSYTLTATSSGLTPATSGAFNISAGPATKIGIVSEPASVIAGGTLNPALLVNARDQFDNVVESFTADFTVAITIGSGSAGAQLAGTVTKAAIGGAATFSDLSIGRAGSGYTLTATADGLTPAVTTPFDVAAAAAAVLVITVQPSAGTSGMAMSPITVELRDVFDNIAAGSAATVTLAITAGTGMSGAMLAGTVSRTTAGGVATFNDLSIDKAASGYTLTASAPGLVSATSATFDIVPGAPALLVFSAQPTDVVAGEAIAPAAGAAISTGVQVSVRDATGNDVTSSSASITLQITSGTGTDGALLLGTITQNAASGMATFNDLSIERAGSGYTLTATSSGLQSAASSAFSVAPAAATKLAIVSEPSAGTAGVALGPPLEIEVRDPFDNQVSGELREIGIAITAGTGAIGAVLGGTTMRSTSTGSATFADLTIDRAASDYTLTAASPSLASATTASIGVSPGAAAALVFAAQPSASTGGAVISPAIAVAVHDAFGNATAAAGIDVTLSITPATGNPLATLGGTTTRASVSGTASFDDVSVDKAGSAYTLTASASNLTSGTSTTFDVAVGSVAKLAFSVHPATSPQGTVISPAIVVEVQDAGGNLVAEATNTIDIAITTGSGTPGAVMSGSASRAAVSGSGTFDDLSLDLPGMGYTLTASASALASAVSNAFGVNGGTISGVISLSAEFMVAQQDAVRVAQKSPLLTGAMGTAGTSSSPSARKLTSGNRANPEAVRSSQRPQYLPGELIVTYKASALGVPLPGARQMTAQSMRHPAAALRSHAERTAVAHRGAVLGVASAIRAARIRVAEAAVPQVMAVLAADPNVEQVERHGLLYSTVVPPANPLPRLFPRTVPNDPGWLAQAWNYEAMDLSAAWSITTGSSNVIVAVVDDGIRFDHPAIAANLTSDGYDFVSSQDGFLCGGGLVDLAGDGDGPDPDPTIPVAYNFNSSFGCYSLNTGTAGHGLHVAGTIGAVGNDGLSVTGVNWNVRIRPVRVLNSGGSGSWFDVAKGILYAAGIPVDIGGGQFIQAPSPARIINLSLGGGANAVLENAVQQAVAAGALLIAAAGNDNTSTPSYPAAYPEIISVASVGPDFQRATYSNFGSTIDVAAPGGDLVDGGSGNVTSGILSTQWNFGTGTPAYAWLNGTSMAAPHVSGVAALLLAQNGSLSATEVRARLLTYAVDLGAAGRDDVYGEGLVNARNSLTQSFGPATVSTVARLYSASTGALVAQSPVAGDGSFAFQQLLTGTYWVFGAQDHDGDALFGIPGRRWGAAGMTALPTTFTVTGSASQNANFGLGFAIERESNDAFEFGDVLVVGGHLFGFASSVDTDYSIVRVAVTGQYTFETMPFRGACGFGADLDTVIDLYDGNGQLITSNDDIDFNGLNFCSRITVNLAPGTYYLTTRGYETINRRYYLTARSGA